MKKNNKLQRKKHIAAIRVLLGVAVSCITSFTMAQRLQTTKNQPLTTSPEDISYAVENYLSDIHKQLYDRFGEDIRIDQKITAPDSRLSLAQCEDALLINNYSNRNKGRISIKVSCSNPTWSTYVPVDIAIFTPVVSVLNGLKRGDLISVHDLSVSEANISNIRGQFFRNTHPIIGKEAKRNIKSGDILLKRHIQFPVVVKKGEQIFLTAKTGRLSVKIPVTALRNGRVGDAIRVRNESSNRVISAKITAPGQAQVAM